MRRWFLIIPLLLLTAFNSSRTPTPAMGIILAGEPVRVSGNAIEFTSRQIRSTSPATRVGLARWVATTHGRRLLQYFTTPEYQINVVEDPNEPGIGRAPEPGIITFLATSDHKKLKVYTLILNPMPLTIPEGMTPLPHEPATSADFMSAAWAGEMLHIYLYSQGIRLPHHHRDDFQEPWQAVAKELGFPAMAHGETDDVMMFGPERALRDDGGWRRRP